jgi:DNA-binding winged helix-turn-helix (wHTH) protein/tetratricopeptide (TPR) repeat protein
MAAVAVRFGDYELSVERVELRRGGQPVAIEPQVFDVLAYLVRNRDRVVPKTELLDQVWGDRFVSESALTSRIKSARRAIGDTGRDQRAIKTVHGRGYRFVLDVADDEDGDDDGDRGDGQRRRAEPRAADDAADRVLRVADDLVAGQGAALRIEGGTRAARTELLHRLADEGRHRGLVVGMSAPSITSASPFACVGGALDEMTQRRPDLLDALPAGIRAEIEQVIESERPTTRQRWLVAARELLLVASEAAGALLLVDHADHAPAEALALVDDVARLTRGHRVAVVVAGRHHAEAGGRGWFEAVELPPADGAPAPASTDLPREVADALRLVAVSGDWFDELELQAATGHGEAVAHRLVDAALAAGAVVPAADGFRFAAGGVDGPAAAQPERVLAVTARRLAELGAPPERVADRLHAAGRPAEAAPYALAAAHRAAAVQLHREVLRWTGLARDHVGATDAPELLCLRADALAAVGDPAAVAAYRAAIAVTPAAETRRLRVRLARAALVVGDRASAEEALAGVEPDGGPDDAAVLYSRGLLAYWSGDIDLAEATVEDARHAAITRGTPGPMLDAVTLQGLVAHSRGEWFDRLLREMRAAGEDTALATTVFDSHLCVAEYLLYGPTPYAEVVDLAERLRDRAVEVGARPAAAFATLVAGEASLLSGDLDAARTQLADGIEQHIALGADSGTAHALQRLAEVELAAGDRAEAERLLRRALGLARWSPLAHHLLQRIYGTLVASAPDREAALAVVDEAAEASDQAVSCTVCHVMIAVPAAIACAEGGRLEEARSWLVEAERSAALWQGTAWQAAVREARAHLARAEDDPAGAARLLAEAAVLFEEAGQPLDARRCREASAALDPA